MKNSLAGSLALLAAIALAAGCGGGYGNTNPAPTPTPVPTPTVACTMPPGTSVALSYPPPVPATTASPFYTTGVIIAVAPSPLPTNWFVYVTSTFSSTPAPLATLTSPPSPMPSNTVDPKLPGETFQYSPGGGFGNGGTFSTFLANANCFPGVPIPGGTFKT